MVGPFEDLLKLPQEILDEILSQIDLHHDLVAFACVSKACHALVIPRHSEYRVLRIRHKLPNVWAHLARRADLARNIREVHICERHNNLSPDRYPQSLVKAPEKGYVLTPEDEETRVHNMCKALGHMDRLRVFTWSCENVPFPEPTVSPLHENEILGTLEGKEHLRHVALAGGFEAFPGRANSIYPLWKLSNLQQLSLSGRVWFKPNLRALLKLMLKACPTLEALRIPMELTVISDMVLPRLKKVKIVMQSGGTASLDKSWVGFLQRNKSLEEVYWFPIGDLPSGISSSALPRLKRVHGGEHFLRALYASPRSLETIDTTLEPAALVDMEGFDGDSLREIRLGIVTADAYGSLRQLAGLCPNLRLLKVPNLPMPLDMWMDIFSHLPKLEVFLGLSLWSSVKGDMDQMHVAIMKIVQRCSHLRQLDHSRYDYKRGEHNKIILIREGEEGRHVRYEIRKALPLNPLSVMM